MPEEVTPTDSDATPEEAPSSTGDSPVGDLSAALSSCQITWQHAESWNEFIEALATVEATAMQEGHLALHDVCIALRECIVHLSEVQPCPDDEQCAVLATWPSFATAWSESPGDSRMGELLVEFLRHPMWSQPLGSDEAEILSVMLGVESGAYGTESLIETVIDTMYTAEAETDEGDGKGRGNDGLPGYDGLSGYAKLGAGSAGTGKIVPDVRARMSSGIDSSDVEDLSTGMDLGGFRAAEEHDANAPETSPIEHALGGYPAEEAENRDPRPIETEGVEPESMEHALVEPEIAEPEFAEPELAEPELSEPELSEPELAEPELAEPELAEPELAEPELAEPELAEPEFAEPELSEPELSEPGLAEPELAEPELAEPELAEPELAEPELAEPELAEPELAEPELAEPELAEPELAEPELTEPELSEPELAEPELAEPEFAESAFGDPELTEPERPEPELGEPEAVETSGVESEIDSGEYAASETTEPEPVEAADAETAYDDPLLTEQDFSEPESTAFPSTHATDIESSLGEHTLTEHGEPESGSAATAAMEDDFSDPELAGFDLSDPKLTDHDFAEPELADVGLHDDRFVDDDAGAQRKSDSLDGLPETAREMIHLLVMEAAQIATALADVMPLATSETVSDGERCEALDHFAEQVERFNGAVELLGLEGLLRVGRQFHQNIIALSVTGEALPAEVAELLVHMCTAVPAYLAQPLDRLAGSALTSLLAHSAWPQATDSAWAAEVEELLASPVVDVGEDEGEERAVRARPEDVSLALPGDVDMEVLDGLLQDLPGQTAEFSRTVETLVSGGAAEDVEVAQRIAHTVKGAANTVGVAGLANLTHHLEDILLVLGKHGVIPGKGLSEVLVRSADCLESMGETLLGQCAPPTDALDTLQSVLDWANTIDNEGVAAVAGDAMTATPDVEIELDTAEETIHTAPVAATPMVRVPAPLVDDLLRLVGETIILTGQIQERLSVTERESLNMRKQYNLVQQLGQEMEELIDLQDLSLPQQRMVGGETFDALEFDQYNELHTCSRRLVEAATDSKEVGRSIEEHLSALSDMLSDQSRLNRENQEAVLKTRMVAVQTIVPRLQRSVRQASRLTGKDVELRCIGTDTLMDSDVLGRLLDPLMHVLRNAVDHGIESRDERETAGKNAAGEIRLEFQREGNHIVVRCADDGGGLDFDAIREAAKARDMLGDNEQLPDEELTQLILRPNFSTRTEATQLSGRGIGLDAVNMQVSGLGGSLRLQSETGQGCQVIMRLPLTLISTHALLVRVTSHVMAVATRGVEQVLHPDAGELSHFGDQTTYRMVDAVYPCTSLARLLGLPGERRSNDRERCPALLVQGDNGLNVVLVDGVSDSRELVIKSMGKHLPKIRGLAGATILGDGSVTPVLDLPELLREPSRRAVERPTKPGDVTGIDVTMPYALVVDDSLSARRSLAQFMTDSGFQVRTARDGLEAVKIMQSRQPDLLLVDLEMPRMNGLELTHHVRANEETRDVPVIMITSRSTDKHRRQAKAAGVTQYLTKPYAEDELMEHVYNVCTK